MRHLFVVATLVTACVRFPTGTPGTEGGLPAGGTATGVAAQVITYTNEARAREGLPALRTSSPLMEAARIHAAQMSAFGRLDHTISEAQYPDLESRLLAVSYEFWNAAENIAWNESDPRSVVDGWMRSSGHRANILDSQFTDIGASMARDAGGTPYWIQVFGRAR